jgi:hypothetical protein
MSPFILFSSSLLLSIKYVEDILDWILKLCIFTSSNLSTFLSLHFDYEITDICFLHFCIFQFKHLHHTTHKLCILRFLQLKFNFPSLIIIIGFQNTSIGTCYINISCVYVQDGNIEGNLQLNTTKIIPTKYTPWKPFSLTNILLFIKNNE